MRLPRKIRKGQIRIKFRRRSVTASTKNNFFMAGVGKTGLYAVGRRNIGRKTGVKVTTGTLGTTVGVDRRIGKKTMVGIGYNVTSKKSYAEIKRKGKKYST